MYVGVQCDNTIQLRLILNPSNYIRSAMHSVVSDALYDACMSVSHWRGSVMHCTCMCVFTYTILHTVDSTMHLYLFKIQKADTQPYNKRPWATVTKAEGMCNRNHNRNLGISRAPLKSQVRRGIRLFTSAATNQRGCPKGSPL